MLACFPPETLGRLTPTPLQINRGGEKISPLEVDAALLSIDGVGEAVAFGVADEKFGEKVRYFS